MSEIDNFLAGLDDGTRAAFERVLAVARDEVPGTEDGKSYGMAALRWRGKPLLGFAAAKAHLSVFPFSPQAVDGVRDRLAGYDLAKGTIRFTAEKPLPDDVVRAVVRLRAEQINGLVS